MRKIAFLLVIFLFPAISATAQINEILKRVDQHQRVLKSLEADIVISKFSAQAGETSKKEGVIKFFPLKKDYMLRVDSTKPAPESFIIFQNQYLLYLPDFDLFYLPVRQVAYTGTPTDQHKNMFVIFSGLLLKENLRANYSISYKGEEKVNGNTPTWHLELTPKIPQSHKLIELWVDGNGMPLQSKTTETGGETSSILLTNLKKNVRLKGADFKIDLPKDTQIIKN